MCTGSDCRWRIKLLRSRAVTTPVKHQGEMFTHSIVMQRNAHVSLLRRLQESGVKLVGFDWEPRIQDNVEGLMFLYEVEGTQSQIEQFKTFAAWDKVPETEE